MSKRPLIWQTYVCCKSSGKIEYGFTFKHEGEEDSVFDLVLGEVPSMEQTQITLDWETHQWAAEAIVNNQRFNPE